MHKDQKEQVNEIKKLLTEHLILLMPCNYIIDYWIVMFREDFWNHVSEKNIIHYEIDVDWDLSDEALQYEGNPQYDVDILIRRIENIVKHGRLG